MDIKKPELQLWDVEKLIPYELNSKIHDKAQIKALAKGIKDFGWDQPIVVDAAGVIIKGHGRRLAAIELGLKKVPVLVRDDLTPEQVKAARLADNKVAITGFDNELLKQELEALEDPQMLADIFSTKELTFLNSDMADLDPAALVADLDEEVRAQERQTIETVAAIDNKDVPLAKAFGFKAIKTKDEKYVAAFLAQIEEQTGLSGADAFVAFAKRAVSEAV